MSTFFFFRKKKTHLIKLLRHLMKCFLSSLKVFITHFRSVIRVSFLYKKVVLRTIWSKYSIVQSSLYLITECLKLLAAQPFIPRFNSLCHLRYTPCPNQSAIQQTNQTAVFFFYEKPIKMSCLHFHFHVKAFLEPSCCRQRSLSVCSRT